MDIVEAKSKTTPLSVRHPWELARLEVIKKIIINHATIPDGSKVLDIGCGDIFVAENLALSYPNAQFFAIDTAFDEIVIENLKKNQKTNNLELLKSINELPESIENISLVLLLDIIEHMENDVEFLRKLINQKYINEKTNFIITVPSFQSLFCSHDAFLGHYRRYTNKSLKNVLKNSGLKIILCGYFFFTLIPIRAIQVIKERIFKVKPEKITTGVITWDRSVFLTNLLKYILLADAIFSFGFKKININLPGLSSYAVCRKSHLGSNLES
jgi:hypothetical protein